MISPKWSSHSDCGRADDASFQSLDPNLALQLLGIGASKLQALWLLCKEARLPLSGSRYGGNSVVVISEVGASMMVGGNIRPQTRGFDHGDGVEKPVKANFDYCHPRWVLILLCYWCFALTSLLSYPEITEAK